jgi:hypothetical protein
VPLPSASATRTKVRVYNATSSCHLPECLLCRRCRAHTQRTARLSRALCVCSHTAVVPRMRAAATPAPASLPLPCVCIPPLQTRTRTKTASRTKTRTRTKTKVRRRSGHARQRAARISRPLCDD